MAQIDLIGEQNADGENSQTAHASWRSLFSFARRSQSLPLSLALIASVASGIIIPALAVLLGKIFDLFTSFGVGQITGPDLVKKVSTYGLALFALGCGSGLINAIFFMLWLTFGELQAKNAREKLFDSMLEKDMEWFDMRKSGTSTLISRLQTQIRELQLATSQPVGFAIQYSVTTIAALALALYYSWSLALVTLAATPISAVILSWISTKMQPSIEAQVEQLTSASKLAHNAISAIDTVKSLNGQNFELWQYSRAITQAAQYYFVQANANALQIGFVRLAILGMFVQGFWYGSHLVNTGRKSPGEVLTAFWACLMATEAIEQILPQIIVLEKGRAAGATLLAMMQEMESGGTVVKTSGQTAPSFCEGDIEIRKVSFSYPSRRDQPALDNASLFFPAGETTFVIGRSGSGKSTLGNLMMRFYDPRSGTITIDGKPVHTLDINWLRNNVTLVQQQNVLFNETIFKNVAFGRRNHDRVRNEEIKRAVDLSFLQDTIDSLPEGLNTIVGTGGNAMSGGQKQRVAIARACLRDTPILILDEATSALDHITKTFIIESIRKSRKGKTTIIITHDMSQIQEDDYAYVLNKGIIVQEGFKHALKEIAVEPFSGPDKTPIGYSWMTRPRSTRSRNKMSLDSQSRVSGASHDLMDTQIHPRRTFLPSMLGLPTGDMQHSQASPRLLSPLSPVAFQRHRSALTPSMYHSPKRKSAVEIELPAIRKLPESNNPEYYDGQGQGQSGEARENRHGDNSLEKGSGRLSPTSLMSLASSEISGVIENVSKKKRHHSRLEKARQIPSMKNILLNVWPCLTWSQRLTLVLGFFCAGIHAAATPLFSWVFSKLLSTFFLADLNERSDMARIWSLSVLGVAIIDSIASYAMHYLLERCGQAWIDTLRLEALKRILDQPREWFDRDKNSLTKITEYLDRNAEEMRNLLGRFAGLGLVAVIMMVIALVWSVVISWKLTLVALVAAPFLYAMTRSFESVSGKWEGKSNDAGERVSAVFTEIFANIRTVRALTLEGYFRKKYTKATTKAFGIGIKRSAYSGIFFGISDSGIMFVTALIFYYGAHLASTHTISTQDIFTVFTMLLFSIANVNTIVAFIPQISSSCSTASELLRLAHLPYGSSHEHTGSIRLFSPGSISFTNTSFTYPTRPTAPILNSLDLTIQPGMTTALVGASGSGKSTISSLLLALYTPDSGAITVNNVPIQEWHTPTLRRLISIVPQAPTLFPASVADNIAYAVPEHSSVASMDSITAAAEAAGIDTFISSLPNGYNTLLGPGGTELSGGQAQRIAIARAVLRKPRLLILDEATGALDGESTGLVRDLVIRMGRQRIGVLVITHDEFMMKGCGEIVVLKDGKVAERGTMGGLLRRQGGELRRLLGKGEVGEGPA